VAKITVGIAHGLNKKIVYNTERVEAFHDSWIYYIIFHPASPEVLGLSVQKKEFLILFQFHSERFCWRSIKEFFGIAPDSHSVLKHFFFNTTIQQNAD